MPSFQRNLLNLCVSAISYRLSPSHKNVDNNLEFIIQKLLNTYQEWFTSQCESDRFERIFEIDKLRSSEEFSYFVEGGLFKNIFKLSQTTETTQEPKEDETIIDKELQECNSFLILIFA